MKTLEDIKIEEMTLGDLDRVMEIEHLCYPSPWSRRAFQSELTENSYAYYYVARKKCEIVGYIGLWVILDEAHITNIAVHPDHRRQGIARHMLEFAFQKAREKGANRVTLEVRVSNIPAQTLYKSMGFVEKGIRKGYYTDRNEDAIIMAKENLGPSEPPEREVKWMA